MPNPVPHTPGPWAADERVASLGVIRGDGVNVAQVLYLKSRDIHEQRANARLIAAAPEMLVSLRELSNAFYSRESSRCLHASVGPSLVKDARALLARIEGKETQP